MTTTHTTKWEDLEPEKIVENYIRLKNLERERNKKSYENLKLNKEKYFERLNKNYINQIDYIEEQKANEQKLKEFKQRRKEINKRAYEKRKLLNRT
jgi:hypothetical protein